MVFFMRLGVRVSWVFFFVAYGLLFYLSYKGNFGLEDQYQSDLLQVEQMYRDIFIDGNSFWDWVLPGSLYLFDFLLYSLIRCGVTSFHQALALFSATQIFLFGFSIVLLRSVIQESKIKPLDVLVCTSIAMTMSLLPPPLMYVRLNYIHFLGVVVAIFCTCLYMLPVGDVKKDVVYFLLLSIGVASDPLVLLWHAFPVFIFSSYVYYKDRIIIDSLITRRFFIVFCSVLCGKAVESLLRQGESPVSMVNIRLKHLVNDGSIIFSDLTNYFVDNIMLVPVAILSLLLIASAFFNQQKRSIVFFLLITFVCAVLGIAINGKNNPRYLLYAYVLVVVIIPTCLFPKLKRQPLTTVAQFCLLFSLATIFISCSDFTRRPPHPEIVATMDDVVRKTNSRTAFAGYWDARLCSLLSREGLSVAQASGWGSVPDTRNSSVALFRDKYSFVILENDKTMDQGRLACRSVVEAVNGVPDCVYKAGSRTILYYAAGARMSSVGELLWRGAEISPSYAKHDIVDWSGDHRVSSNLALQKVVHGKRWKNAWMYLVFESNGAIPYGEELTVQITGEGAPWNRRIPAMKISKNANDWKDYFLRLFAEQKSIKVSKENTFMISKNEFLLFFKMPNRNIRNIDLLIIEYADSVVRLF